MSKKVLVAYFSASGTTKRAAEHLAATMGADVYEILPEKPYTNADLNWNDKNSRSSMEMSNPDSRPAITDTGLDITAYDKVLIGFPVWWYIAPTIINTFIESQDFSGKDVVLFATSGGSGIENCEKNLKNQYPQLNWKPGRLVNNKNAVETFAKSM